MNVVYIVQTSKFSLIHTFSYMSFICLSRFDKFSMTRSLALKLAWKIVHTRCSPFILIYIYTEVNIYFVYFEICFAIL